MAAPPRRRRVDSVRLRNVVLVVALAVASWLGAEMVLDMLRVREPLAVPPIVLEVKEERQEPGGKRPERRNDQGDPSSPGAQPALPPAPPPAGDDDDDDGGDDSD